MHVCPFHIPHACRPRCACLCVSVHHHHQCKRGRESSEPRQKLSSARQPARVRLSPRRGGGRQPSPRTNWWQAAKTGEGTWSFESRASVGGVGTPNKPKNKALALLAGREKGERAREKRNPTPKLSSWRRREEGFVCTCVFAPKGTKNERRNECTTKPQNLRFASFLLGYVCVVKLHQPLAATDVRFAFVLSPL